MARARSLHCALHSYRISFTSSGTRSWSWGTPALADQSPTWKVLVPGQHSPAHPTDRVPLSPPIRRPEAPPSPAALLGSPGLSSGSPGLRAHTDFLSWQVWVHTVVSSSPPWVPRAASLCSQAELSDGSALGAVLRSSCCGFSSLWRLSALSLDFLACIGQIWTYFLFAFSVFSLLVFCFLSMSRSSY